MKLILVGKAAAGKDFLKNRIVTRGFNGWYYGLTHEEFNQADVMIMSKDGLAILPTEFRNQCLVIYLDPSRMTRVERLNDRADINDTIHRRMSTDDEQFKGFQDYDLKIKNGDF